MTHFFILAISTVDNTTCPDGWSGYSGNCYTFNINLDMDYFEADAFCKDKGGRLASLDTMDQRGWFTDAIQSNSGTNASVSWWVGGYDHTGLDIWRWPSGNLGYFRSLQLESIPYGNQCVRGIDRFLFIEATDCTSHATAAICQIHPCELIHTFIFEKLRF